jgi:hypothetical protein
MEGTAHKNNGLGFEVLTAVVMKSSIFWDIMWCCQLKVNRVSEEHVASIFRVEEKTEQESSMKAGCKHSNRLVEISFYFLAGLIL